MKRKYDRELALVRVEATGSSLDSALDVVGRWSARLLELEHDRFTVELAGEPSRVSDFLSALEPFGEITASRSGVLNLG